MSWNFEAKEKYVYFLVGGSRPRTRRGEELGRIVSIEPGNHSDLLKVYPYFCLINTCTVQFLYCKYLFTNLK